MKLEIGIGSKVLHDPSLGQIEDALRSLPGGDFSHVILSRDPMTYIQTAGGPWEGFVLEYQDGSVDKHYQCADSDLGLDAVVRAFRLYAQGDERWRTGLEWRREIVSATPHEMKLEIGIGPKVLHSPSLEQIEEALRFLPGGVFSHAILSQGSMTYIQAAGGPYEGFVLEYQEGSLDKHYRCTDGDLDVEAVVRAFQLYAQKDERWRAGLEWERMEL